MTQIINTDLIHFPDEGALPITHQFIDIVNEAKSDSVNDIMDALLRAEIQTIANLEMRIKSVIRAAGLVDGDDLLGSPSQPS